jgi:hypothetical protein
LTGAIERIQNVTYILATDWEHSPFPQFYEKAKVKGWKTLTMLCGHDVMLDKPEELSEVLLTVAQPAAARVGQLQRKKLEPQGAQRRTG